MLGSCGDHNYDGYGNISSFFNLDVDHVSFYITIMLHRWLHLVSRRIGGHGGSGARGDQGVRGGGRMGPDGGGRVGHRDTRGVSGNSHRCRCRYVGVGGVGHVFLTL